MSGWNGTSGLLSPTCFPFDLGSILSASQSLGSLVRNPLFSNSSRTRQISIHHTRGVRRYCEIPTITITSHVKLELPVRCYSPYVMKSRELNILHIGWLVDMDGKVGEGCVGGFTLEDVFGICFLYWMATVAHRNGLAAVPGLL
jgi:hypothetical protein